MYIDGNLKGGFQTVKAYAEFCANFRSWMEERSMKLWPPRIGEIMAQDYRSALDYVNKSVSYHCTNYLALKNSRLSLSGTVVERSFKRFSSPSH